MRAESARDLLASLPQLGLQDIDGRLVGLAAGTDVELGQGRGIGFNVAFEHLLCAKLLASPRLQIAK